MVKTDEKKLMVRILCKVDGQCARELADDMGMNYKRAYYLFNKWMEKDLYESGVNAGLGWLTPSGVSQAKLYDLEFTCLRYYHIDEPIPPGVFARIVSASIGLEEALSVWDIAVLYEVAESTVLKWAKNNAVSVPHPLIQRQIIRAVYDCVAGG